jgi:hypothetical protein
MTGYNWHPSATEDSIKLITQFMNLEINEAGKLFHSLPYENKNFTSAAFNLASVQTIVPQEVYILTIIILNTINTKPSTFHNIAAIPGLEYLSEEKFGRVAHYLIKQYLLGRGWIEAQPSAEGLLIKLTLEGKLYLKSNNAWA